MATVVIGHDFIQLGDDVLHLCYVSKKTREFPYFRRHLARGFEVLRLFLEDVGKMMGNHRRAGPGRNNHVLRIGEHGQEMARYLPRLLVKTAVEGRLTAAGL